MKHYSNLDYLAIDLANNFSGDLDKLDFEDRISWFEENKHKLSTLVNKAENPSLFYAGTLAYQDISKGKPTGYLISLDACSSGIQVLSALSDCESSATLCGLNNEHRVDVYTAIYEKMSCNKKFTRKQLKDCIMTTVYSSQAQPIKLFGKDTSDLEKYYEVLETNLTGCYYLNKLIETFWNNKALSHDWVMPDGFDVHIPVMEKKIISFKFREEIHEIIQKVNKTSDNYRSLAANTIHSIDGFIVREISRRCNYNPKQINYITNLFGNTNQSFERQKDFQVIKLWDLYKKTNILSLKILDYLDKDNFGLADGEKIAELILSLPIKPFKVLSVHDCFKVLPSYGNDIRQQFNNILSEINDSHLIDFIFSCLNKEHKYDFNKKPETTLKDKIKHTNYALS